MPGDRGEDRLVLGRRDQRERRWRSGSVTFPREEGAGLHILYGTHGLCEAIKLEGEPPAALAHGRQAGGPVVEGGGARFGVEAIRRLISQAILGLTATRAALSAPEGLANQLRAAACRRLARLEGAAQHAP